MADLHSIYNWHRIDDRITTSGQPSESQLMAIAASGVERVINLALHDSPRALPDEAASVAHLGMTYVHIPVDFKNPTEADFTAFCAALAAAPDVPVHVHCAANYRVSAFFYRYRRDVLGMDQEAARAELEKIWQPDPIWSAFIGLPAP